MNQRTFQSKRWSTLAALFSSTWFMLVAMPNTALGQCDGEEVAFLIGSDLAANDLSGNSVAIDGDTAVVGNPGDDNIGGTAAGSAYVFVQSGGVWTQQVKLLASDGAEGDTFGTSVAIYGDTIIVGAQQDDHAGGAQSGSAYIFVRSGGVWSQQAKLTASDAAANDFFGISVALFKDTAVIGAFNDDHTSLIDPGGAYVFVRCGTTWSQQTKLTAADAAAGDRFGRSVAIHENRAVVGASSEDNAGGNNAGAAYVFVRAGTFWSQTHKLTASDAAADDFFGDAVAVYEDTIVSGSPVDDHAAGANAGAAYVFVRDGAAWPEEAKLTAPDGAAGDEFGNAVAVSDTRVVVGAQLQLGSGIRPGAAYIYGSVGGVWTFFTKLMGSDPGSIDLFGESVSLSGDLVAVGVRQDDTLAGANSGSAHIFDISCDADDDGVPDEHDACPDNASHLSVCENGRPMRDCNNDCLVDPADIPCIVNEMLGG